MVFPVTRERSVSSSARSCDDSSRAVVISACAIPRRSFRSRANCVAISDRKRVRRLSISTATKFLTGREIPARFNRIEHRALLLGEDRWVVPNVAQIFALLHQGGDLLCFGQGASCLQAT